MRPFSSAFCIALALTAGAMGADSTLVVPQLTKPSAKLVEGDPLQQEYDEAWSQYEESIIATTAGVNKALDAEFDAAADAGNFPLADMWDKKKKVFADTRTLEWPTDAKAKTEWRQSFKAVEFPGSFSESVQSARDGYLDAVKKLESDYTKLSSDYTKARQLERAKQLLEEWAALERKPAPGPEPPRPVPPTPPAPPPKPWPAAKKGAVQLKGHWYKVFPDRLSWHQAKAKCEEFGGHLVTIDDAEEEAFIRALAGKAGFAQAVWLGVTDQGHEGQWVWVDGKRRAYSNWGHLQPNNKDNEEHYAVLRLAEGDWMDLPSFYPHMAIGFVCEWDE